jgi:transketolase
MKNYEQTLLELAQADERIIVMTAENRAAIRNLPNLLPGRFIDTGITEQTMVGAAAGLALRGRVPVLHALATFLTLRAFEFVRTDVGIGGLPVKLVGGVPGFLSDGNGPTHQAIEDVSLMRGIPGCHVFCPADEEELVLALPAIINSPNPTYIRHNALKTPGYEHEPFEIGKAEVRRTSESRDAPGRAILVYGFLLREAWEAKARLEAEGLSVRLVNVRMPKPIDVEAVLQRRPRDEPAGDGGRPLPDRRPVQHRQRDARPPRPDGRRAAYRPRRALVQARPAARRAALRRLHRRTDCRAHPRTPARPRVIEKKDDPQIGQIQQI